MQRRFFTSLVSPQQAQTNKEGYRSVWEWEKGRVCFQEYTATAIGLLQRLGMGKGACTQEYTATAIGLPQRLGMGNGACVFSVFSPGGSVFLDAMAISRLELGLRPKLMTCCWSGICEL